MNMNFEKIESLKTDLIVEKKVKRQENITCVCSIMIGKSMNNYQKFKEIKIVLLLYKPVFGQIDIKAPKESELPRDLFIGSLEKFELEEIDSLNLILILFVSCFFSA